MRSKIAPTKITPFKAFVLSKFLRIIHITTIAIIPITAAMSCFNILSGAEEPTTARLSVVRKNAMVSISKAVFPRCLITPTYIHIASIKPPMAMHTSSMYSVPRAMLS